MKGGCYLTLPLITAGALVIGMTTGASRAHAEFAISAYGGIQGALDSKVKGNDPAPGGVGSFDFNQRWEGRSFRMPPYWGVRATWWVDKLPGWGVELDYSHSKVYADPMPAGWKHFEFTDGLNILTLNAMYRWQKPDRRWTPYIGLGAGISVPHVEVRTSSKAPSTFEYQLAGVALQTQVGIDFAITDRISAFGEYKFNYTINDVSLKGGGDLKTNIATNAFNVGFTYHFM